MNTNPLSKKAALRAARRQLQKAQQAFDACEWPGASHFEMMRAARKVDYYKSVVAELEKAAAGGVK